MTDKTWALFCDLSDYDFLSEFTFVGGSAVAYYLNHRLSEDLDFFTWYSTLPAATDSFIKKISKNREVEITNYTQTYLDIFIDGSKVTLFANDWNILKTNRKKIENNIYAAHLDLLCAMKINALSLRAKFRDYYDLYVLNIEKYSLNNMLEFAFKYIPGITKKIFGMQLTYIDDIEDENINHLVPKYKVSLSEIQMHFTNEFKKIL